LPFLPMAPIQVLTNNLLYDLSQTAIPTDAVDEATLQSPQRWEIEHISRFMLFMGPVSSVFDCATFALMAWGFHAITPDQQSLFHTGWLVESLMSQTLIIHILRTGGLPFVDSQPSRALLASTVLVCGIGAYLPYSPLASALGLVALPWPYWPALTAILLAYLVSAHLVKRWFARRHGWL
jgi:P-type Mg2+ transporter